MKTSSAAGVVRVIMGPALSVDVFVSVQVAEAPGGIGPAQLPEVVSANQGRAAAREGRAARGR